MEEKLHYTFIDSPVGYLKLISNSEALLAISFSKIVEQESNNQPEILLKTKQQLKEYFNGKRKQFDLLLDPSGTEFQKKVWKYVSAVPFGSTASYLEIAKNTGSEKNTRAVGLANGKNPIPIIIPCHRVIGSNGKLTGYAGGIDKKRLLLQHELHYSESKNLLF